MDTGTHEGDTVERIPDEYKSSTHKFLEIQLLGMYTGQSTFSEADSILSEDLRSILKDICPWLYSQSWQTLQFDVL